MIEAYARRCRAIALLERRIRGDIKNGQTRAGAGSLRRAAVLRAAFCVSAAFFALSLSSPAGAGEAGQTPSRASLLNLSRDFVNKIGKKLEEADILLKGGNKLRLAELRSSAVIPEGEPLIMQGFAGQKRLVLANEVYAIRQNDRLMMSLGEFCSAADFPIAVSAENGTASGWFMRQDRSFYLDADKGEVTIRGETQKIDPQDISVDGQDILVSSTALEKWFDIVIDMDFSSLAFYVTGTQLLPVEERDKRKSLQGFDTYSTAGARLPLRETSYGMASSPYLDLALNSSLRRDTVDEGTEQRLSWSAIGAGDLMRFSSKTYIGGDHDHLLATLRQTFSREDPNRGIGGPLRAAAFEFGDVYTLSLPMVGGGFQEQGVYLSSRTSDASTTLNQINVRGDAQPGWDVELYNNDTLVGFQTVADNGQYNFESVLLYAEENNLRLVFYGPQGEIREETRRIIAGTGGLGMDGKAWDVSLTRTGITTYTAKDSGSKIEGDPRLSLRYEQSLGPLGTMNAGFLHRSETDGINTAEKQIMQMGIATGYKGMLVTSNLAYNSDSEYLSDILLRRNYGRHQTGLLFQHSSGGFSQGGLIDYAPDDQAQIFARGPLSDDFMGFKNVTYSADILRVSTASDSTATFSSGNVSGRYGNLFLSTGLRYNISETNGNQNERMTGFTTANGFFGKGRWRLTSAYDLDPFATTSYTASYTYPLAERMKGVAKVTREADTGLTELDLSADWRTNEFAFSPYVSVDTDHRFALGVNMRFSLAEDPYNGEYQMVSRSLTDSGGAAGRVFLDANGDGVYNEGEELLPEVELKSMQTGRNATTDAKGVAFILGLPRTTRTDIAINNSSLPDPYYMTMMEGESIRPRPGVTEKFDFPVVVSGEMDGQVDYITEEGRKPGRNVRIRVVAPDGRVEKTALAAYDGYWSISGIRPGVYYLAMETDPVMSPGYVLPEKLVFAPDGTTFFGHVSDLVPGHRVVFNFRSTNAPPGKRKTRVVKPEDIAGHDVLVELGDYHSRLALAFAWYKFRLRGGAKARQFELVTPLADIRPDPRTALMALTLRPLVPMDMRESAALCAALQDDGFKCAVTVVTRYRELVPTASADENADGKRKT